MGFLGVIPSVLILGAVAVFAGRQAARTNPDIDRAALKQAALALGLATLCQGIHFLEEAAGGFHAAFPGLFGLPPMPFTIFVSVNVALLIAWLWSTWLLWSGVANPIALWAAWFLGIAGILNLIAHPAFAALTGGYFPGLWTSIMVGGAAAWLCRQLSILLAPDLH